MESTFTLQLQYDSREISLSWLSHSLADSSMTDPDWHVRLRSSIPCLRPNAGRALNERGEGWEHGVLRHEYYNAQLGVPPLPFSSR